MRLSAIRAEQGLTQEGLAARAGVTHGAVSYIEGGHTKRPLYETVYRVCRALKVDPQTVDEFRVGEVEEILAS